MVRIASVAAVLMIAGVVIHSAAPAVDYAASRACAFGMVDHLRAVTEATARACRASQPDYGPRNDRIAAAVLVAAVAIGAILLPRRRGA